MFKQLENVIQGSSKIVKQVTMIEKSKTQNF